MDSFTHAFAIAIPLLLAGNAVLVPFAVIGAVIPDIDGVFFLLPNDEPSNYILTHGGITHSIAGAALLSLAAFIVLKLLSGISWIGQFFPQGVTLAAGTAALAAWYFFGSRERNVPAVVAAPGGAYATWSRSF